MQREHGERERVADIVAQSAREAQAAQSESTLDASFRVYTASELRTAPLRPSFRPSASLAEDLSHGIGEARAAGPRQLLKWLGLGVGGGALLLSFLLVALSLGEDTKTTRSASVDPTPTSITTLTPASIPIESPDDATPTTAENDFELPDDAPTGAGRAASKRAGGKPAKRGVR